MTEVYGLVETHCSRCDVEYEPGNMYGYGYGCCTGMGNNGRQISPIKCMKCPSCGESRRMTQQEENEYSHLYKKITLKDNYD